MNDIVKKQNKIENLNLLFSQRYLYSSAKKYFSWRVSVAILLAIFGPILTIKSSVGVYVAIIIIAYLILDNCLIERIENTKKIIAGKIQELFDTEVLEIGWNNIVSGNKPDMEIIGSIVSSKQNIDYVSLKLKDWYSEDISKVNLGLARFLCQRSNVWWDNELRKSYLRILFLLSFIIIITVVVISVTIDLTLSQFILGIILPMIPLIELIIKQIKNHFDSACCALDLKNCLDETIDKIYQGKSIGDMIILSRTYQDEIYRHRTKCPMIFDWVYWLFRDKQEDQMKFSIETKIREFLKN